MSLAQNDTSSREIPTVVCALPRNGNLYFVFFDTLNRVWEQYRIMNPKLFNLRFFPRNSCFSTRPVL